MFKFVKADEDGFIECRYDMEDVTWFEVVEKFQEFLAGCGYIFDPSFNMANILQDEHDNITFEKNSQAYKKSVNDKLPFGLGDFV